MASWKGAGARVLAISVLAGLALGAPAEEKKARVQLHNGAVLLVTDMTGDDRADILLLVHDRLLLYPSRWVPVSSAGQRMSAAFHLHRPEGLKPAVRRKLSASDQGRVG